MTDSHDSTGIHTAAVADPAAAPAGGRMTGMTLIEMLVAMAATLMLMAAVAQAFSIFGKGISGSRSALDTAGRMRSVAWRLRQDLAGATAPTLPPLDPADGLGYFEIIEGPRADFDPSRAVNDLVADIDDILLFTTRASGEPFRGKFETGTIESDVAEVAWFARETVPATTPRTYTLYRKQLLVRGYVGAGEFERLGQNRIAAQPLPQFYETYDLSASRRKDPSTDAIVPNSLADLTRREFRFLHNPSGDTGGNGFPYWFLGAAYGNAMPHLLSSTSPVGDQLPPALAGLIFDRSSVRRGEDVLLSNVIGFDVRVFDPSAPLQSASSGTEVITPGDQVPVTSAAAYGGYVDLGNASLVPGPTADLPRPVFSGPPNARSGLNSGLVSTYDTWSLGYEADGIDQDKDGVVDQGTDGFDSQPSLDGVIDDPGERETSAPYPYPLRGIEVRIRCYEPTSRQVRQVTVRHTFVPH